MFGPADRSQVTRRSADVIPGFCLDKVPLVAHCAVSCYLSVVTPASQAVLSCHICHLWRVTTVSSREELKKLFHRRHSAAAQMLLDKADWHVFVHPTLFAPFWGTVCCSVAYLTWLVQLQQCRSEFNSEGGRFLCFFLFLFWLTALWLFLHILKYQICSCYHFSWHVSISQFQLFLV